MYHQNKARRVKETHKHWVWKRFTNFCEHRNYKLYAEISNENLADIMKDWARNIKRVDGQEYAEESRRSVWNAFAKLLRNKFQQEFNRELDPSVFENVMKTRIPKIKETSSAVLNEPQKLRVLPKRKETCSVPFKRKDVVPQSNPKAAGKLRPQNFVWKHFTEFCERRNYKLAAEISNRKLADILKDWALNLKRIDGEEYTANTRKIMFNICTKCLRVKFYTEFQRRLDPSIFQDAWAAAKTKTFQVIPEKIETISAAHLNKNKIANIVSRFNENTPDGLQRKFYLISAEQLGWSIEEAALCLVKDFKVEFDKNGQRTGRILYNPIFSKTAQGESKWLIPNKESPDQCPVRLLEKMLLKRLQTITNPRLFLQPHSHWQTMNQWYENVPIHMNYLRTLTSSAAESIGMDVPKPIKINNAKCYSTVNVLENSAANIQDITKIRSVAQSIGKDLNKPIKTYNSNPSTTVSVLEDLDKANIQKITEISAADESIDIDLTLDEDPLCMDPTKPTKTYNSDLSSASSTLEISAANMQEITKILEHSSSKYLKTYSVPGKQFKKIIEKRGKVNTPSPSSSTNTTNYQNDSMPLQQRLTAIASTSAAPEPEKPVPTLKSQPLSPTKLKVTRQSTSKPQQQQQQPPKPEEEEVQPPVREEVCLKWNTHHSNMQTAFPALLNKEQYCDVTLVADGMSLKCHKLILSSCSAYFDQVLEKVPSYQHPIIFMKDIPFNIMKTLCDFMYVGEVNILQSDLDQILAVGESLKIKGLVNKSDSNKTTSNPTTSETSKLRPKPPKVTSKPSIPEKRVSADDADITDPLDLMEPTYEEAAVPEIPPSVLKRNDTTRKSTGRKVRKRKHVEVEHEPSPPVFRMRKGTRSRPNVKVPRYFNANFDNSVPPIAPEPSEFVESNEMGESFNDPFLNILDEIKTEPLDIEDTFEEHYMDESHRELDIEEYHPSTTIEETSPKVLKKRKTSRSTVVAKLERPDPLNVDHSVVTVEEMTVDNSETIEQEDHYIQERLQMNIETSDREEMPVENSDHEERTAENIEGLELCIQNSEEAMDIENSEFEDTLAEESQISNCDEQTLTLVNNTDEALAENRDSHVESSDTPIENSDAPIENSDTPIENSDIPIDNSDALIENSDVPIENSDASLENSDAPIEHSDTHIEASDVPLENSDLRIIGTTDIPLENSDKEDIQDAQGTQSEDIHQDDIVDDSGEMIKSNRNVDNIDGKSSNIAETQLEESHAQVTSENCLGEGKALEIVENAEIDGSREERLNSCQDDGQVTSSEILRENSYIDVQIHSPSQEGYNSNALSTTEKDPLQ